MKVYIQYANGREVELDVRQPDPADGTYTAFLPEGQRQAQLRPDGSIWIRIVPDEEVKP